MNIPSRSTLTLYLVLAGIILSAVLFWQHAKYSRKHSSEEGQLEQKFHVSITDLHLAQNSVDSFFCTYTNQVFAEVKTPVQEKTASPAAQTITLQGVSLGQGNPVAMINETVYQPGDQIGDFILQEVRVRSVLLRDRSGVKIELKLMETNP